MAKRTFFDIIILGGGPAGLAFAASMRDAGLTVALIEKSDTKILATPPDDGREIALTHTSIETMRDLGMMRHIGIKDISPIKQAKVMDGTSPYTLTFDARSAKKDALGYLVPNYVIRRAAYAVVKGQKNLTLMTGVEVRSVKSGTAANKVALSNGVTLAGKLVVAADGRFSPSRRMMGIATSMHDFGRTVVVGRIRHQKPHHNVAYECFHYGRTLAILPLDGKTSSVVITLSSKDAPALLAMSDSEFNADLTERFGDHLGTMKRAGELHPYPLVATYAETFCAHRYALIGDAAVGMHPVTAHGYNFGLFGQNLLAHAVRDALASGFDIADPVLLEKFSRAHRRATLPLYLGTNTLVGLFTDERPHMKLARSFFLRSGNLLLPFKKLVTSHLTSTSFAA